MQTNKVIQFGVGFSFFSSFEQKWENKMHLIEWMDVVSNEYSHQRTHIHTAKHIYLN